MLRRNIYQEDEKWSAGHWCLWGYRYVSGSANSGTMGCVVGSVASGYWGCAASAHWKLSMMLVLVPGDGGDSKPSQCCGHCHRWSMCFFKILPALISTLQVTGPSFFTTLPKIHLCVSRRFEPLQKFSEKEEVVVHVYTCHGTVSD